MTKNQKVVNIMYQTVVELQDGQSWDDPITIKMPRIAWCAALVPIMPVADELAELAGMASRDAAKGDTNAAHVEPVLRENAEVINKVVATIGVAIYPKDLMEAKDKAYSQTLDWHEDLDR